MNDRQQRFLDLINSLSTVEELRARSLEIVDNLKQKYTVNTPASFTENYNGRNSDRFFWEDGGGQEANIIFRADGVNDDTVVMFMYDHDSVFNVYSLSTEQVAWGNLPAEFQHLLVDDFLKWDWDTIEPKVVYATAAIWRTHGSEEWSFNPDLFIQMGEHNDEGGFNYGFKYFAKGSTEFPYDED